MTRILFGIIGALALPGLAGAQAAAPKRVHLEGRWEAKVSDGLHYVMVRADSSAQFGEQVARWRVVGDSIWFTLGDGAWQVYGLKMAGDKLTLSGGDLDQPVTLRRVGPATARPAGLAVPEAPPDTARAWD
ncbi:MAG TPA: hypothetical protein VH163_06575 [Gemmatimonadales bacterium]|jgi:hypothetical protein|nr:hypothetical protein [Gemmatimonadales bacterium]